SPSIRHKFLHILKSVVPPRVIPVYYSTRQSRGHPSTSPNFPLKQRGLGCGHTGLDLEGRFRVFSRFPRAKQLPKEPYFEAVHVTEGQWFYYIEKEQNRMPTRLHHLTPVPVRTILVMLRMGS